MGHVTCGDDFRGSLTRHPTGSLYFRVDDSAFSLCYGSKSSHTGLSKFLHAARDGHVCLLEHHAVTLQPQAGDANDAQDVSYAFPYGGVFDHFI